MTWLFYGFGIVLHVAFKWAGWSAKNRKWSGYFTQHAALNVQAAIAAVACAFLWETGILGNILNGALSGLGVPTETISLKVTPASSLFAGYVLDSMARTLLLAIPGAKQQEAEVK